MSYPTRKLGIKPLFVVEPKIGRLLPVRDFRHSRLGFVLLGLTFLWGCAVSEAKSTKPEGEKRKVVPVLIATATQKTVPILVQGTGTVEAYSTVSVKSQIGGQLQAIYFKEGQNVKKGDLLFKIDSQTQQSEVMQAEANRAKAISSVTQAKANRAKAIATVAQAKANKTKAIASVTQAQANKTKAIASVNEAKANQTKTSAQAKNASERAERYATLLKQGAISKDQADQFTTEADAQQATLAASQSGVENAQAAVKAADADVENAQAAVKAADADVENAQAAVQAADAEVENTQAAVQAAEADVENAKVQLSYSSIFSPMVGRTGTLNINQGNLVKENDTNPLVVISQIRPIYVSFAIPQRTLPELKKYIADNGKLEVDALIPKDEGRPERGELAFVDSGVDKTTGTIKLKGSFANSQERLSPGQFVNVILKLAEERNAIAVPNVAIQTGQKGQFVFVVKPDNTVEVRPVTVGSTIESETVIKQGLKPGEKVVTDGQFNLVPGAAVEIKQGGKAGSTQQSDRPRTKNN